MNLFLSNINVFIKNTNFKYMYIHSIIHRYYNRYLLMKLHNLKEKILNFAREDKVITTAEIAKKFEISWNTAEKYLLELTLDNKFKRIKKTGVNLWVLK